MKMRKLILTKVEYGGSSTDVTSTPRIDEMLSKFKRQQMEAPMTSREDDHDFRSTGSRKIALSVDHEVRLERLEHQLAHVLYKPVKVRFIREVVWVGEGWGGVSVLRNTRNWKK